MYDVFTHTPTLAGRAMRYQRAGSSCLGRLIVISSWMAIGSFFCSRPSTSLLILAWPRMFTLFCLLTPGSPGSGPAGALLTGAAVAFVAAAVAVVAGAGDVGASWAVVRSAMSPVASTA